MDSRIVFGYRVYEDGKIAGKRVDFLSPADNGRGYLIVSVLVDGKRKTIGVHKLVALAFIPNPDNLPEVNHKDGNKLNNHHSNLEWTTRGENIRHAFDNNLRSATGSDNARCKTSEEDVKAICKFLQDGMSAAQIRDKGFDYGVVRAIKARKNWLQISQHYKF